jgi:hypothetical protein
MVGRFQVMALLQAARAKALGYPLDEAESFGLNRAIFYAAAKRGFKGGTGSKHPGEEHVLREIAGRSIAKTIQQDALGDELAYYVEMDGKKRYVMGGIFWSQATSVDKSPSGLVTRFHRPGNKLYRSSSRPIGRRSNRGANFMRRCISPGEMNWRKRGQR